MDEIDGSIQLPYGFLEKEKDEISFNLPKNFKKELLFENLPFVAQLKNPAIENVVKGRTTDDLDIQKYLLATGLLEDTIQNNLDMIVTDGEFNNAGVRRVLDQKYPNLMNKPTATNFIFKDKAKFDIQNPIIGSLYNEILTDKQKEEGILKQIAKAPNLKDIEIKKRLENLKKFENGIDDDDDDDDDDQPPKPPNQGNNNQFDPFARLPDQRPPDVGLLTPPPTPFKKFLLEDVPSSSKSSENVLVKEKPEKINFSGTLQKTFPKLGSQISLSSIPEEEEIKDFDITESVVVENKNELIDLDFFEPGGSYEKLATEALKHVNGLSRSTDEFLKFLSSDSGKFLLVKNKMKIHFQSGNIYIENKSTGESLYNFLKNQEDDKKKDLIFEVPLHNDFNNYVNESLVNVIDDDFDLQTNATSKFLFYNFNNWRSIERKVPYPVKHSEIVSNEIGLETIQNYNWQYFIEKLISISNNENLLQKDDFKDDEEFEDYLIIEKTRKNLNYCKEFYNAIYDDIAYFFQRKIKEIPTESVHEMIDDLTNYRIYSKDIKKIEDPIKLLKIFSDFYFKTGRFPGSYNLLNVPPGVNPPFIKSYDKLSPFEIHEKFNGSEAYGLISVQFLAALNIFFGGNKLNSQNLMSEYLNNLSLQALTIDDDKYEIQFFEMENVANELKENMRDFIRYDIEIDDNDDDFNKKFIVEKDKMQKIFDEIKNKELSTLEYPNQDFRVLPDTPEKINEETRKKEKFQDITNISLTEEDEKIFEEILLENKKKLIKSVTENSAQLSEKEINNITSTTLTIPIKDGKSVKERIDENVKKGNEKFIKKRSSKTILLKKKPYDKK